MASVKNKNVSKKLKSPVIEAFTPSSLADYSRRGTRFGLIWDQAILLVTVTDSEGQKYGLVRAWEKSHTGLRMTGKFNPDVTQASPRLFSRQYLGPINFDLDEERQMAEIRSWPSKHNFKLDIQPGKIHWEEEDGALNLELNTLGPAMMLKDLGDEDDEDYEAVVTTSEAFEVKGTLNGKAVSGFGSLESDWLPPGVGWTQSKIYQYGQEVWIPWATRYDDGSIEYGVKASFAGDIHWGFFVKEGKPILGKMYEGDIKWGDAGGVDIPVEADFQYGDHKFKWVADGRMAIIKGHLNWVSGAMINQSKMAKPIETFAWNEFRAKV